MNMIKDMLMYMRNKMQDQKGATAVEYGIMVALIAAVIITIVSTLGGQIETAFTDVSGALTGAGVSAPAPATPPAT